MDCWIVVEAVLANIRVASSAIRVLNSNLCGALSDSNPTTSADKAGKTLTFLVQ